MKQRINDLSISAKFICLYILGVLLPMLLLMTYVITNITSEIVKREEQSAQLSFDRVYTTINDRFSSIINLGNVLAADSTLAAQLSQHYQTPGDYYAAYVSDILPGVTRYLNAYMRQVTAIEVYSTNPTMFSGGVFLHMDSKMLKMPWYPDNLSQQGRFTAYVQPRNSTADHAAISLVRILGPQVARMNIIKIDLYVDALERMLDQEADYLKFYLVAPDGCISLASDRQLKTADQMRASKPPEDLDIITHFPTGSVTDGWYLGAKVNDEHTKSSVREAIIIGVGVGLMCTLFAGVLCLLFARSIIHRSRNLLWHMDNTTAEHFLPVSGDYGHDEIGKLTKHFNDMSTRLKTLIDEMYVLELKQKNYELERVRGELKYLKAQIDPHFLFNTLNGLLVVSVRSGYTELTEIIRAMSKLFRRMLDSSREQVPLKEEMEFVEMVLKIEQFRFGDKLHYQFDLAPDALDCLVPVMCIQGLVENACKHGIQGISSQGKICVCARAEDNELIVTVSDNGTGVSDLKLNTLRQEVVSQDDLAGSIGLQNIYRRLLLQSGDTARLLLDSVEGQGMTVTLRLPIRREE